MGVLQRLYGLYRGSLNQLKAIAATRTSSNTTIRASNELS